MWSAAIHRRFSVKALAFTTFRRPGWNDDNRSRRFMNRPDPDSTGSLAFDAW